MKTNETESPLWSQLEQCGNETEDTSKKLKVVLSELATNVEAAVTPEELFFFKDRLYWLTLIALDYTGTAATLAKQTQELVAPVIELERNSNGTAAQEADK